MKTISTMLLLFLSNICIAQINVEYISNVPAEFKEKYYSQKRDYNPLQVGNMWQYHDAEYNDYLTTRIVQDSIINDKRYFKKICYQNNPPTTNFVVWERNDSVSGVSFMLDFEDANGNGDYTEELPLDSLENAYWSRYTTYKYSFAQPNPFTFFPGEKTVLVKDTSWVRFEGDTVISRYFEIGELFWGEEIIEKFGIFSFNLESPSQYCTGAIINGEKYGTIVSVEEEDIEHHVPSEFFLENNYPNPFNPSTTIEYNLYVSGYIKLKIYNILGEEVKTLAEGYQQKSKHRIIFNARTNSCELSSGVYIYTLDFGNKVTSGKMILSK